MCEVLKNICGLLALLKIINSYIVSDLINSFSPHEE